ncbi:hypothetical protein CJD50_17770 [Hafnia paralvei]|uniref:Uncharacterized protein n=1 Tax=Hafnia paralvei TaxID=546367 RepID=A0A2A2M9H5_9GAMM|nr:hypothetical protein [Hafnia paralvei]PAV95283.1 hypothetical protein CJD50_17770 [Hafnia paralvei]
MDANYIAYEALVANRAAVDWAFWSTIGTWLSGIATVAAVITSLYLALKNPKIGGCVRLGRMFFEVDDKPVVVITVVNKSLHSIRIKAIFWVVGDENEIQQMFRNQASDPLPIRLEHGDEANYRIIINDDDSWLKRIAKRLLDENASVEKMQCVVALSTGERYRLKIDKRFKAKIAQFMR